MFLLVQLLQKTFDETEPEEGGNSVSSCKISVKETEQSEKSCWFSPESATSKETHLTFTSPYFHGRSGTYSHPTFGQKSFATPLGGNQAKRLHRGGWLLKNSDHKLS